VTLFEWIRQAEARLNQAGVDSARLEAQILAASVFGKDRAWVLTHPEEPVDEPALEALLARREAREPLAYILGHREFFSRPFKVTPAVLIPRQETETLVEWILDSIDEGPAKVLDLATGSGCIGITLALENPQWKVTLSDVSPEAAEVARHNAKTLKASCKVVESDLFVSVPGPWDVIVSNPPYIAQGEIFQPEVRDFEPELALYAEEGGLALYRRILMESVPCLSEGGVLVLELGDGRAEGCRRLAEELGWHELEVMSDLMGIERALALVR
jgi:release factor glutamine methyltransferase